MNGNRFYQNESSGGTSIRAWGSAIHVFQGHPQITSNETHQNGQVNGDDSTIHILYGAAAIRNNTILNNWDGTTIMGSYASTSIIGNILINPPSHTGVFIFHMTGSGFVEIYNNIIAKQNYLIYLYGSGSHPGIIAIYHNTLDNGSYGIYLSGDINGVIHRNIISNNNVDGLDFETPFGTVVVSNNLYHGNASVSLPGSDPIYGDPKFVNSTGWDYHVQPGSPARDQALDVGLLEDFEGDPRPMGSGVYA